jgi:hypothetical protein
MQPGKDVLEVVEQIRADLLKSKGEWPEIARQMSTRRWPAKACYRWMRAFAKRQVKEPAFSKLVELSYLLGKTVRITLQ